MRNQLDMHIIGLSKSSKLVCYGVSECVEEFAIKTIGKEAKILRAIIRG